MFRISLFLACITLSVLFAASGVGLVPDRRGAVVDGRRRLTEVVALQCSQAVRRGEFGSVKSAVEELMRHNPDVVGAAIHKADGTDFFRAGSVDASREKDAGASSDSHMRVPLTLRGHLWGNMELHFCPLPAWGWLNALGGPIIPLAVFLACSCLVSFFVFLKTVLRHVDEGKGKLIPDRVRKTLNTFTEGILVLDRFQRIALANDAFAEKVGQSVEQLTGRKASELNWKSKAATTQEESLPWVRALREGKAEMGAMLDLKTEHFGTRKLSVNSNPIVNDDGVCRGAFATFDDMTAVQSKNAELMRMSRRLNTSLGKIRRQKKDLVKAKVTAEEANRAKGEFLANVSHEIRTPMNAIIGMTEITLDMELPPEQREYIQLVKASADSLLSIINEILDYSKIEAGKFKLDPVEFTLRDSFGDALKLLAIRAHKKGLEILCDIRPEVPDYLIGDPERLRQIVVNLVGNAIKFTHAGEIVVRVEIEKQEVDKVVLHFSVTDTGIGIPADKLNSIFDPFTQADGSTTRKYGGTGLGLAICLNLVDLMGGRIWVESTEGKGSTFHFTTALGLPAQPLASAPPPELECLRGLPALVVDDNATSCRILQDMLRNLGLAPQAACNGSAALGLLSDAGASERPFALILIDGSLPDMEGFQLVQEIRNRCLGDTVVIMMLSSPDRQADIGRCRELGAAGYIIKPAKPGDLVRVIQKACGNYSGPDETPERELGSPTSLTDSAAPPKSFKILLVDDNAFNQKVGQVKLKRAGHRVQVADSGHEALAILEKQSFDLILMDMQMPHMDGIETTAEIRRREAGRGTRTPIIALTAHAGDAVREECLRGGMDGYLSKPIRDDELWQAIRALVPEEALTASTERQEQPSPTSALNKAAILDRVGGNTQLLRELAGIFQQDCGALLETLREGVDREDGDSVRQAAHTLKGMVAFFAAADAVEAAADLEASGKNQDFSRARVGLTILCKEIETIQALLACLLKELPA